MKEAIFQTIWLKYLEAHKSDFESSVFELKLVKSGPFQFSQVKPHQIEGLLAVSEGLPYKIMDAPIYKGSLNRFNSKKPFDCVFLKKLNAYVVVSFYKPRKKKQFICVLVKDFIKIKSDFEAIGKKSIKEDELKNQASFIITV